MTGVRLKLDGTEGTLEELGSYVSRARDPRGLFDNIGAMLTTSTQHRFDEGVGVDGSPWPPSLRVLKTGGKTLVKSARLYRSFSYNATATGLEFGTTVVYAAIHHFGGLIRQAARTAILHFKTNKRTGASRFSKPGKADRAQKAAIGERSIMRPARPFIGIDDADERGIITIAETYLAGEGAAQ